MTGSSWPQCKVGSKGVFHLFPFPSVTIAFAFLDATVGHASPSYYFLGLFHPPLLNGDILLLYVWDRHIVLLLVRTSAHALPSKPSSDELNCRTYLPDLHLVNRFHTEVVQSMAQMLLILLSTFSLSASAYKYLQG